MLDGLPYAISTLVYSADGGACNVAATWAREHEIPAIAFPFRSSWAQGDPAAEQRRNVKLLTEARPDLLLAFPGAGVDAIVARAIILQIPTYRVGDPNTDEDRDLSLTDDVTESTNTL